MKLKPILFVFLISLLFFLPVALSAQGEIITPMQFLPGDNTIGPSAGDQLTPEITQGGNTLLAVWSDRRSGPAGSGDQLETASDIYGMRLDASGNLLDTVPFPITQGPATQENPKAVWNGTNWLVVYESYSVTGTGYYYEKSLEAVRVSPSGQVLDTTPIRIYGPVPFVGSWAVASDGNYWAVAFEGTAVNYDLQVVRITSTGVVQLPARSLVPAAYYLRFNLRLAYASGVYLLTWQDSYDTKGIRFDQAMNPLDSTPLTMITGVNNIADLTSNGSQFYMVWEQQQPNFSQAVMGSRVSTAGVKLDGNGVNISGANQPAPYTTTAVAWDGTYWKVSWAYNNAVSVARVNSAGQVVDPGGVSVAGPTSGPTAATTSGGLQLIWVYYESENNVVSAHIAANNSAGPNRTLSIGSPMQVRADVAVGSSGYMVVYQSLIATANRVMAHPLDANGNPLTTAPVQLETGPILNGPGTPTVAWNGSLYLVAWSNGNNVMAQRIQQNGTPVDAAPFVVMAGFGDTDVAAVGDTFLVVAHKISGYPQFVVPVAARVRGSDGVVLDNPSLGIGGSYTRSLAVTRFNNRWLVVWQQNASHNDSMASTVFTFVNTDGTFTPAASAYGPYSSAGGNGLFEVGVAASDTVALVVQSNEVTSGVETDLVGQIINTNGTLGTTVNLTPWIGNQYRPRVAWDGSQFIVVFSDQKNRFAPQTLDQLDARGDLFGMRINPNGTIVDPKGFAYSTSPLAESYPNITAVGGVSLLTSSLMRNESPLAAYRVGYSRLGVGGNAWPIAVAGANPTVGTVPFNASFSSAGSSDPNGSIVSYLWEFGDGSTSTQANPSHVYTVAGNYVAHLTVTDNQGATSTNTVAIQASAPNQPPIAVATAVPASGTPPLDVSFYADGSYDPDGSIGNIYWDFGDGGNSWGSPAFHTFYQPGTYQVTLTLWDNNNATGSTTITVNVSQTNPPPVAVASATPTNGAAPLLVNFSSAGSYDPNGTITSYAWNFGDGGTSNQANPSHTYNNPGTYNATLTVTDNQGATGSDSVTITVTAGNGCTTNCLRSTAIAMSARIITGQVRVTSSITVKNENGVAIQGATVAATWTLPNGTTQTTTGVTGRTGIAKLTVTNGFGTYIITINNISKTGYTFDPANSILTGTITRQIIPLLQNELGPATGR